MKSHLFTFNSSIISCKVILKKLRVLNSIVSPSNNQLLLILSIKYVLCFCNVSINVCPLNLGFGSHNFVYCVFELLVMSVLVKLLEFNNMGRCNSSSGVLST